MSSFSELGLIEPLLRAIKAEGYTIPTPVQEKAIPIAIQGIDILGVAQTGTGKTAAFTLPILQWIEESGERAVPNSPRALILTPTRELAIQIDESIKTYGRHVDHKHAVIFGGVGQGPQVTKLRKGIHTLVATPGRLLDLMQQGHIRLDRVGAFVLDEADRMLDMGFINDVRKVVAKLPDRRQSLLFSATMPSAITTLAEQILWKYERIEIRPAATTADRVEQRVLFVLKNNKRELLQELFDDPLMDRAIVFTRTKHGADKVAKFLNQRGIQSNAIHGNKSQSARQRALGGFKDGQVRALIATDIASRGIDIDDVSHVINFDLPNEPESYVHRIGRTARAGADGMALSFCDADELEFLDNIEKIIRQKVPIEGNHSFHEDRIAAMHADHSIPRPPTFKAQQGGRGGQGGGGGRSHNHNPRSGGAPKGGSRRQNNRGR
ncbi:MAG: ATP-dependent RNA helicase RhlE [Rhodothermales bacterium]